MLLFSGEGGVGSPNWTFGPSYYEGMAEHPSLEYVRVQADGVLFSCLSDTKLLLIACPALRVLDFSEYQGNHALEEIRRIRRHVAQFNTDGAGRLTHVFFRLRSFTPTLDAEAIINVLGDTTRFDRDYYAYDEYIE